MSDAHKTSSCNTKTICLLSIVGLLVLFGGLYLGGLVLGWSPTWYQNYAPEQPIPFSHKIHAGQFQIPCLYCHSSAEATAHAEVPGLEVCMNCHTQVKIDSPWIKEMKEAFDANRSIPWVKVHVLPDFVYFNHRAHVAAGVACQTCHGPVETMDKVYQYAGLHMGWCMECHRNDDYVTTGRAELAAAEKAMKGEQNSSVLFEMLSHPNPHNADVSCSTCHR